MKEIKFELAGDYIELIKLLKLLHIAESGAHAKGLVEQGKITLNGRKELRKRAKIRSGDVIGLSEIQITIRQTELES
jgi:ribosome-associated protein